MARKIETGSSNPLCVGPEYCAFADLLGKGCGYADAVASGHASPNLGKNNPSAAAEICSRRWNPLFPRIPR